MAGWDIIWEGGNLGYGELRVYKSVLTLKVFCLVEGYLQYFLELFNQKSWINHFISNLCEILTNVFSVELINQYISIKLQSRTHQTTLIICISISQHNNKPSDQ